MVEHHVHNDAGRRNIKPDRENEPSQLSVRFVPTLQASPKRNDHEWSYHRREYRVGCENGEIYGPRDAVTGEPGRPESVKICADRMVRYISNKENRGNGARSEHTHAVCPHLAFHYEKKTGGKETRAQGVQPCIHMGKDLEQFHLFPETQQDKEHDPKCSHEMPIPANDLGQTLSPCDLNKILGRVQVTQEYRPKRGDTADHVHGVYCSQNIEKTGIGITLDKKPPRVECQPSQDL